MQQPRAEDLDVEEKKELKELERLKKRYEGKGG